MGRLPYENLPWMGTQKHMLQQYKMRYEFGGFIIGPNGELAIVRHPLSAFPESFKTQASVASQTGLNIIIKDERDVVGLKITDEGAGAGDLIQIIDENGDVGAKVTSGGTWTDASLGALKNNIKGLTDKQLRNIVETVRIHRFEYKKEPGVIYLSPEATEFHELTNFGDPTTIAPKTIASLALRLVQWMWGKMKKMEERLAAIETRLALEENGEAPQV